MLVESPEGGSTLGWRHRRALAMSASGLNRGREETSGDAGTYAHGKRGRHVIEARLGVSAEPAVAKNVSTTAGGLQGTAWLRIYL